VAPVNLSINQLISQSINVRNMVPDMSEVLVDHNLPSPWWQWVRDACSQSEQNLAAFITALVCRQVSGQFAASQTRAKVKLYL
jgi:hypothetical protein